MIPKSRLQTDSINVQLLMQANKKRGAEVDCKFNPNFWTNLSASPDTVFASRVF